MATRQGKRLKYGEMLTLGYNAQLPRGNLGRKRSKFNLNQRLVANGVELNYEKNEEIVQGDRNENTDMFQFGRSNSLKNDFVLLDRSYTADPRGKISRFACRVVVDRNDKNIARIYASGFDSLNKIWFDESAIKWRNDDGSVDGLTENGVLIAHPTGVFRGGRSVYEHWYELSVTGNLFSLRESRESNEKGELISTEDNVLKDGTLISLGGVTMLWRSAEGLSNSVTDDDIENLVLYIGQILEKHAPFNEVSILGDTLMSNKPFPHVHVECGHVQFYKEDDVRIRLNPTCPACLKPSAVARLCMGQESAVYVDYSVAVYAFNPCGHVATEKTAEFWKTVRIPDEEGNFITKCPFCAIPLNNLGCVKLKFPYMARQTTLTTYYDFFQHALHSLAPSTHDD